MELLEHYGIGAYDLSEIASQSGDFEFEVSLFQRFIHKSLVNN